MRDALETRPTELPGSENAMGNRARCWAAAIAAAVVATFGAIAVASPPPPGLKMVRPEDAGMDGRRLRAIDEAVDAALAAHQMPGCVVLLGRHGKIVFEKAYGNRQVVPDRVPMTPDTVFDLASLTKPVATATSVMVLIERGALRLDDPVARHIPEFAAEGKGGITVLQLLTHQGGLVPDNPLSDYADGPEKAKQRLLAIKPVREPGSKFVYSDVGFMVLGELVRRVSKKDLGEFTQENVFLPLGMHETGFLPPSELRRRAAPTEKRDGRWIQGEVHDPRSYALGGIAGHAGLFSTAHDLAIYAQMLLGRGRYDEARILRDDTVATMTSPRRVSAGIRAIGWDMRTGYSSNRGQSFSSRAFGHGGFTGTSMWIDPGLDLFVIFLSNRLHPDGKGSVNSLAGRIGTIAADAIVDKISSLERN
jgi:CubicO group peptidase (beta-lactamase class C family)